MCVAGLNEAGVMFRVAGRRHDECSTADSHRGISAVCDRGLFHRCQVDDYRGRTKFGRPEGIDNIAVVSEVGMFLLLGMGAALSTERRAPTTACFADERSLDD